MSLPAKYQMRLDELSDDIEVLKEYLNECNGKNTKKALRWLISQCRAAKREVRAKHEADKS